MSVYSLCRFASISIKLYPYLSRTREQVCPMCEHAPYKITFFCKFSPNLVGSKSFTFDLNAPRNSCFIEGQLSTMIDDLSMTLPLRESYCMPPFHPLSTVSQRMLRTYFLKMSISCLTPSRSNKRTRK